MSAVSSGSLHVTRLPIEDSQPKGPDLTGLPAQLCQAREKEELASSASLEELCTCPRLHISGGSPRAYQGFNGGSGTKHDVGLGTCFKTYLGALAQSMNKPTFFLAIMTIVCPQAQISTEK